MSPKVPKFEYFMLKNKIGNDVLLRRRFAVEERWCYVAGILGLAADSPVRGWLFVADQVAAEIADLGEAAGVPLRVAERTVEKAMRYGLIEQDAEFDCYWVPNFEKHNPQPRHDPNGARRQALHRDPQLRQAIRERDGDFCRYCGTEVKWHDRRGRAGGTYDHVDPDGPNDATNLVVACRSCNSAKGNRTLTQIGFSLRPALGPKSDLSPVQVVRGGREVEVEGKGRTTSSSSSVARGRAA